ncbi:MAG: hypothetical protein DMD86_09870, partial [Candidatus Rokuibacteriota bacterium]
MNAGCLCRRAWRKSFARGDHGSSAGFAGAIDFLGGGFGRGAKPPSECPRRKGLSGTAPIITLTTDFGLRDPFVGIMKGVILSIFPGLRVSVQQINLISSGGFRQTPFNLILRGPDLGRLEQYAAGVIQQLKARTGFVDLDTAQSLRQPEVQVHIDRQKASDLGVRVDAVAAALRTMVGGEKVGFYREGGEQYDVRLRLKEDFRGDASVLSAVTVPG